MKMSMLLPFGDLDRRTTLRNSVWSAGADRPLIGFERLRDRDVASLSGNARAGAWDGMG